MKFALYMNWLAFMAMAAIVVWVRYRLAVNEQCVEEEHRARILRSQLQEAR